MTCRAGAGDPAGLERRRTGGPPWPDLTVDRSEIIGLKGITSVPDDPITEKINEVLSRVWQAALRPADRTLSGALASSLGFDRDDLEISLGIALVLLDAARKVGK